MNTLQDARVLRVVVIDDTADLRDLLRIALARGGMQVVGEAGDGLAGIEAVRVGKPDVVLLDLSMPVMDGLEALPHIRSVAPDARIIVLSGFGASHTAERAMEVGADGYLQKGASLGRILDHIRDIVDDRPIESAQQAGATNDSRAPVENAIGAVSRIQPSASPNQIVQWDALAQAPFGVIELGAEPPYRLVRLNLVARDLLDSGPMPLGSPLHQVSTELASTIAEHRLRGGIDFEAFAGTAAVRVSLRHLSTSLLVYLQPIADESAKLRTAIATTAHEIRGPVAVLGAIAEIVSSGDHGELDSEQHAKMMASITRQTRMLESITSDLLTAAQIQRGTLRVEARLLDPIALIEALIQDRYTETVAVELADRRSVWADPLRLEQMISNLLSNAHKYGQPPVVLRTRPSPDDPSMLCIDVQDNGFGVAPEFREQLFREFSRASGSAVAGTGLGLHVVHTLAKAQGGTVSYDNAPNGGAVFTLCLPTTPPDADAGAGAQRTAM